MKRSIADVDFGNLDLGRCLVMLSRGSETRKFQNHTRKDIFECKTCNRQFSSFQALGGHRASHKKTRLSETTKPKSHDSSLALSLTTTTMKPKMHECSICGLEFSMGQALGGHMRRHRADMIKKHIEPIFSMVPVLKRSNSSKRVMPDLDLNLTPLENDLKLFLSKMAPSTLDRAI